MKKRVLVFLENHPRLLLIIRTPDMRTDASLIISSGVSLAFSIYCILSGLLTKDSNWFITLGIYNLILCIMRIYAALELRKSILLGRSDAAREAKITYRISLLMLIINMIFIGIMAETIIRNRALMYPPFLMMLLCIFSIFRIILVLINAIKNRKEGSTIDHAIRLINITVALCSVYITQTATLKLFCSIDILRLFLNLLCSSIVFYWILRLCVNNLIESRKALTR